MDAATTAPAPRHTNPRRCAVPTPRSNQRATGLELRLLRAWVMAFRAPPKLPEMQSRRRASQQTFGGLASLDFPRRYGLRRSEELDVQVDEHREYHRGVELRALIPASARARASGVGVDEALELLRAGRI